MCLKQINYSHYSMNQRCIRGVYNYENLKVLLFLLWSLLQWESEIKYLFGI